jgi:putative oxidoreductase
MSLSSYFEQKLNRPDLGLLVLRVVFGLVIITFGVDKLLGGGAMLEQIGGSVALFGIKSHFKLWGLLCALTESLGGLCIMLGVFTRPAAGLLFRNMIVASTVMYKMTGAPDFSSMDAFEGWLGKVAVPVYFGAVFLALFFSGPGKFAFTKGGGRSGAKSSAK